MPARPIPRPWARLAARRAARHALDRAMDIDMPKPTAQKSWQIVDFDEIDAVECPCGTARRAFFDVEGFPGTVHRTEISCDAQTHYHRRLTEVYYILKCGTDARMQLDDEQVPVAPGKCILIPPGVRHRALGKMTVLVIVFPKFDPTDEWFD
jgi:mannose-6-phosphate isomerase-like protein (cupin superfamily)